MSLPINPSFESGSISELLLEIHSCTLCNEHLPFSPRPVLQVHPDARILIAGQAPGSKVHQTGIPFDDASGERLRDWMGIPKDIFYDAGRIAILPMGFCFPGTGKSGDLAPRKECAPAWRQQILDQMPNIELTLVIGQYAQAWHMQDATHANVTEKVRAWKIPGQNYCLCHTQVRVTIFGSSKIVGSPKKYCRHLRNVYSLC